MHEYDTSTYNKQKHTNIILYTALTIKNKKCYTWSAKRKKRTRFSRSTKTLANSKRVNANFFCLSVRTWKKVKAIGAKRCKFFSPFWPKAPAQRRRVHEARSANQKNTYSDNNVCTAKARARVAKREKQISSVWQMTCATNERTRGAKRGFFFRTLWQMTRATKARTRNTKRGIFFSSSRQMTCATKAHARGAKFYFPDSDRWRAQRKRARGAKREIFFSCFPCKP